MAVKKAGRLTYVTNELPDNNEISLKREKKKSRMSFIFF